MHIFMISLLVMRKRNHMFNVVICVQIDKAFAQRKYIL